VISHLARKIPLPTIHSLPNSYARAENTGSRARRERQRDPPARRQGQPGCRCGRVRRVLSAINRVAMPPRGVLKTRAAPRLGNEVSLIRASSRFGEAANSNVATRSIGCETDEIAGGLIADGHSPSRRPMPAFSDLRPPGGPKRPRPGARRHAALALVQSRDAPVQCRRAGCQKSDH
jgi:hypothetical protein